MMGRMSAPIFPYRNKQNGLVGSLTAEQAAVFPDVLELVVDEEAPPAETPTASAPTLKKVTK